MVFTVTRSVRIPDADRGSVVKAYALTFIGEFFFTFFLSTDKNYIVTINDMSSLV